MKQTSLFDLPSVNSLITRRAAGVAIRPDAAKLRGKVLAHLIDCGQLGATDAEIQAALKMSGDTQRPRRRELQQVGMVEDSGQIRNTASGRAAVVWRVSAKVLAAHTATSIDTSRPEPPAGISADPNATAGISAHAGTAGISARKPPRGAADTGRDPGGIGKSVDAAGDGLAPWEHDDQADTAAARQEP